MASPSIRGPSTARVTLPMAKARAIPTRTRYGVSSLPSRRLDPAKSSAFSVDMPPMKAPGPRPAPGPMPPAGPCPRSRGGLLFRQLGEHDLPVALARVHELVVSPDGNDPPRLEHHDLIRGPDRAHPLSHDDHRRAGYLGRERRAQPCISGVVER